MTFEVKLHRMGTGFIQAKYLDPKTGKRKRKRFSTLKEAKKYKKRVEDRVNSKGVHAFTDLRISQAMKSYIERFPATQVRSRKVHFKSFIEKFGIHRVNEITTSDLQSWLDEIKQTDNLSARTVNHIKTQFNGFFKYLKSEQYIPQNPMDEVYFKRFDAPRRKRVILSVEGVREVLKNAEKFSPEILYPYLACVAHTGARRSEVLNLNVDNIDFSTGLIHLQETKNSHDRFVRISPMLEGVLKTQVKNNPQGPLVVNKAGERLQRSQLAGLMNKFKAFFPIENKDWGSHSLRHSFAYNFLKKSGKMYQLQAILGHRSINVTVDLYGQLQAQDIECPSPYEHEKETNS